MTDPSTLLQRHTPRLVYDAQEAYFADSAAIWTDSPTNVLRRRDGTVIAKPPQLSLDFLGSYPAKQGDVIGDTTRAAGETPARAARWTPTARRALARDRTGRTRWR